MCGRLARGSARFSAWPRSLVAGIGLPELIRFEPARLPGLRFAPFPSFAPLPELFIGSLLRWMYGHASTIAVVAGESRGCLWNRAYTVKI